MTTPALTVTTPAAPRFAGHIPSLDGIRAISIALVFFGHAGLPPVIRDTTGVTVFFFLSGYLITTLLRREFDEHERIDLRAFYLRRVFRIWPSMYFVLAIAIIVSVLGWLPSAINASGSVASALQVTNYFIIFNGRAGLPAGMNALWSLAVEEHYYLLFPVAYILLRKFVPSRRTQAIILVIICGLILVWRCYLYLVADAGFDRVYLATDTRADSILFGSLFAIAYNPMFDKPFLNGHRRPWLTFIIGLGFFVVARAIPTAGMLTIGHTIEAVGLFFIFTAVITAPKTLFGRFLNWKPVAFVGVLSYSIYLVHEPILLALQPLGIGTYPTAAVALVLVVAVSWAMHRFIEKPMGRLRKRLSRTSADRPGTV